MTDYHGYDWLCEARAVPLLDVARALSLDLRGRGRSLSLGPCPSCGEERRGSSDRRGPLGLTRDAGGWCCHRCEAKGDGLDLASWVLDGGPLEGRERAATVRGWYAAQGWCEPAGDPSGGTTVVRRRPPRRLRPPPEPPPARERTPAEIRALWEACLLICDVGEVAAYLEGRGIPAAVVEDLDLARALPRGALVPGWAAGPCGGGRWPDTTHRLIVPAFDARGSLATVQGVSVDRDRLARILGSAKKAKKLDKLWPCGGRSSGAVFACPLARLWLAREPMGDGSDPAETVRRCGLVVTEGGPDFLDAATTWGDACEDGPAVVGVAAGSWGETSELGALVPDRTTVTLATDPDKDGERYAENVARSLEGRCILRRWYPKHGMKGAA
jgi:hypothetical protein